MENNGPTRKKFIGSPLIDHIQKYFHENKSEIIYLYVPYIKTRILKIGRASCRERVYGTV